jgi:hypothetical protein
MTYQEHHAVFTRKAKGYPVNACRFALDDCHRTLKLWGDDISPDYSVKLWAEIDAMRERIAHIERQRN